MSEPEPTSPEVADACRRAGYPHVHEAQEGINAAAPMVAGMASSFGDDLARAVNDLQALVDAMARLYGPALPAPIAELAGRLGTAWSGFSYEVWEGRRDRDRLSNSVGRMYIRLTEVEGERDRARRAAVALEQEIADRLPPPPRADITLTANVAGFTTAVTQAKETLCACGDPDAPGVRHRFDGPCEAILAVAERPTDDEPQQ